MKFIRKLKLAITSLLMLISTNILAQNAKIENLLNQGEEISSKDIDSALIIFQKALKISTNSNDKKYESQSLGKIGKMYYFMSEVDSALKYFKLSLKIADEIKDYEQAIKICNNLGVVYLQIQQYKESYSYFKEQLNYSKTLDDSMEISNSYNNFGSYFLNIDNYDSSIFYYKQALEIAKKINDQELLATINTNMAIVYSTQGNLTLSLKYNIEAAKIFKQIGNLHNYILTIGNIGALYIDNNEYQKAKQYLVEAYNLQDSVFVEDYYMQTILINLGILFENFKNYELSEKYLNEAFQICKKNDDIKSQIIVYLNLINIYIDRDNLTKALDTAKLTLDMAEEIESGQYIVSSHKVLGKVYNKLGQYSKAIENLQKAYDLSLEIGYFTYILDVLSELKYSYKNTNEFNKAFETDELYIFYQDSISGVETQKKLAELTTIYETEKKEQEIEKQKLEISAKNLKIKQSNIIIFSVSIVLILVIIIVVVLFFTIRAIKKINKLLSIQKKVIETKNEELNQLLEEVSTQKEEIERQRDIANEQKAEIIASINYAQKIQEAILTSQEMINEILPENFILFKPRNIVSGDFYWIKKIKNFTIVAAADCTGHGVPGAFMSMLGTAFLNELVSIKNFDNTGKILNNLRDQIKKSLKQTGEKNEQKDGMDIALYAIDTETMQMQFSGAYNSIYIVREVEASTAENIFKENKKIRLYNNPATPDKTLIEILPDRQPVAIYIVEKDFTSFNFQLQKNDCLYTFSDGFADQFGGTKKEKLKSKTFKSILISLASKPMSEQKDFLNDSFEQWKGNLEQVDDVLVIGVRV